MNEQTKQWTNQSVNKRTNRIENTKCKHQTQQQKQVQTEPHDSIRKVNSTSKGTTQRHRTEQHRTPQKTTGDHGGPQETRGSTRMWRGWLMTKPFSLNKNHHPTVFNVQITKRTAKLRRIFWSLDAYCFRNSFLRKLAFTMLIFEIFIFQSIYLLEYT